MTTYTIAVFVGSLRRDSINHRLLNAMIPMAPADFALRQIEIGGLPLYNQDDDDQQCSAVVAMKREIAAAQGILFVTPEYNRSIPGVLKNAIDHASRPYGQNSWHGKPAGIVGASTGGIGTALAQQHLRNILAYLEVPTMSQPEAYLQIAEGYFDEYGDFTNSDARRFLRGWMDEFAAWVKLHNRPRDAG